MLLAGTAAGRERWTELNMGPFYVYSQGDVTKARQVLTELEQTRWVLGGLLESKDLQSLWPICVILTNRGEGTPAQFVTGTGRDLLVLGEGEPVPLDQVAGILLDDNTPRFPEAAEAGLRALFGTLEAHGSRVTWGGPAAVRNLDWARMQLFATKFEYQLDFHIFVTSLKNGSTLRVAERNAFGKDPAILEKEAQATLAAGSWQAVSVSGRPLDPKRDFGQHSVEGEVVGVYLADAGRNQPGSSSEAAYKAAIEAGGRAMPLGYAGLAALAERDKQDPRRFLEDAIRAGSDSAVVYLKAAQGRPPMEALPLLKRAAALNPQWAAPIHAEAELSDEQTQKEKLLKQAVALEPRNTAYWTELARLQTSLGQAAASQGSWLRAEDSAPSAAERERVHRMRMQGEEQRLATAEAERRRERDAIHLDNQRAEDAETARIRAAESKANRELASEGGGSGDNVVSWDSLVPQKKIRGSLLRVDCLKQGARLSITDVAGKALQLLLPDPGAAGLTCGGQNKPKKVTISYAAEADDQLHTAGRVTAIQVQ